MRFVYDTPNDKSLSQLLDSTLSTTPPMRSLLKTRAARPVGAPTERPPVGAPAPERARPGAPPAGAPARRSARPSGRPPVRPTARPAVRPTGRPLSRLLGGIPAAAQGGPSRSPFKCNVVNFAFMYFQ